MRIPRIYQPVSLKAGTVIELEKSASHHLTRVLRLRQGAQIILFNGRGGEYTASLNIDGKKVHASINQFIDINRESPLEITLLQGISKGDRMDFAIQKSVELGVRKIVPVICQRTVVNLQHDRLEKKIQHWQGIIINACEQSGRTQLPTLCPPVKFHDCLATEQAATRITLDPEADTRLQQLTPDGNSVALLIGPEGGLSGDEIAHAGNNNFQGIQLGPRILRTETAALATVAAIQQLWGDFSS